MASRLRSLAVLSITAVAMAVSAAAAPYPDSLFSGMRWRGIGPYRGGRVIAVTGVPGEGNIFYFGGVAGGVWKSIDGGATWRSLTDKTPISSVGALAVAPSDPNVIYVGTGEACIRGNTTYGNGVWRSSDGGRTWTGLGLADTRQIGSVIVDPRNPDVVFVAALGHAFGPNEERGVFRSRDGGKTWEKVLYRDADTGAIQVVFDPNNPRVLFAALWQVRRQPWYFSSGGPGSGLYRSGDGGTTWKRLEGHGLPGGLLGRITIAVSKADSSRVYAMVEAKEGGLFRSDDGGETWQRVNDDERIRQRAWYFSHIWADPVSADTLYLANTGLFRSVDGGKSLTLLPARHGDHHALWIDPTDPRRMINGSDGGASVTMDGGQTWSTVLNQPTAQFYHVITDDRFPYRVYGAQQDNSTIAIASRTDNGIISARDWYDVGGGESGYIAPDPRDPDVVFAGSESSLVTRFDKKTEQAKVLGPWPLDTSGRGAGELAHRFNWTAPVVVSKHAPHALYVAAEVVFRSLDDGMTWKIVSPDLTRNDKSRQKPSGGPIQLDITSVEYYDTIFALAESPLQAGVLWAGTDDGRVHVTRDGAGTWTEVTPKDLPEWSTISLIDPSPFDAGTAYIAVDRHRLDDIGPHAYKATEFGKSWTRIDAGLPAGAFVHVVREDPKRKGLLYAGTETGVFVSFDDGGRWQALQLNLPVTPIHDLVVHDDDLVAATHGRSFWILDDLEPLRQIDSRSAAAGAVLYKPQRSVRLQYPEGVERRQPVGENPPPGAILDYYLAAEPKAPVTIEILDASGAVVRTLSSQPPGTTEQPPEWPDQEKPPGILPRDAGHNRFPWDLRADAPVDLPGAFYQGLPPRGPVVPPGTYTVRLTVDGKKHEAPLVLAADPRVKVPAEDLRKQFDLAMKLRDRMSDLHRAVNRLRDVRIQLDALAARLSADAKNAPLVERARAITTSLTAVEEQLVQVQVKSSEGTLRFPTMLNEQMDLMRYVIESADGTPTAPVYEVFDDLSSRLDAQMAVLSGILRTEVPAFNEKAREAGISAVVVP